MKFYCTVIFFAVFFSLKTNAQNDWEIGVGASITRFINDNVNPNEKYLFQVPRLNITKRIDDNFSIDAAISFNTVEIAEIAINEVNYFSVDTFLRYSVIEGNPFFKPYTFLGISFISVNVGFSPALNGGIGNTFWISEKIGINAQAMYKFTDKNNSHFQFTGGLIFNLTSGRGNLWD